MNQHGYVLDVLVQSRRNTQAAERLMRKLLRKHGKTPQIMITENLTSYAAANQLMHCRYNCDAKQKQELGVQAFAAWKEVTCAHMMVG